MSYANYAELIREPKDRLDLLRAMVTVIDNFGTGEQKDIFHFCYLREGFTFHDVKRLVTNEDKWRDVCRWFRVNCYIINDLHTEEVYENDLSSSFARCPVQ